MDFFKNYAAAQDRAIQRKRFNPNLTHGEYNALSENEKSDWDKGLLDFWAANLAEPKVPDKQWDHDLARAEGWGWQDEPEKSL